MRRTKRTRNRQWKGRGRKTLNRKTRKTRSLSAAMLRAHIAGQRAASLRNSLEPLPIQINRAWYQYWGRRRRKTIDWHRYMILAQQYVRGYKSKAKATLPAEVPVPTAKSVAAVMTVMNEAATLDRLLRQLDRLHLTEKIVVINGSTDGSFAVAKQHGAIVYHDPEPLGHDVGRAIGARLSKADIVLFLDGDIPVVAEQLLPFIDAVNRGADIALNNVKPYMGPIRRWDAVTVMKEFMNRCLGRSDLSANSLTAVPHAISRKALEAIGVKRLSVPPVAQAAAILEGLKVNAPASVNVFARNKVRRSNTGPSNPVSQLIVGDHIEALQMIRESRGTRMGYPDSMRNRAKLGGALT